MDGWPSPGIVDLAALAVIAAGAVHGFIRGLSGELAHAASVLAALVLGLIAYRPFGGWVLDHTRLSGRPAYALAFAVLVVAVIIVMLIVRCVLKRIMKVVVEKEADRLGGVIAGVVRATAVVTIVFVLLNLAPHDYLNRKFGEESLVGTAVMKAVPPVGEIVRGLGMGENGSSKD